MIIKRTRHRIESTSLMDMNHRYIKEYYQFQKCLERLICTLAFELFIVSGLSELKANNLQWSVASIVFSQFLHSCHTSSRLPWVDSLFLFIFGTSHMSQISSCNSMILRVSPEYPRQCMPSFVCNPLRFASNISQRRMLPTCAFFFQCSWSL
jgi:hypothetical protein